MGRTGLFAPDGGNDRGGAAARAPRRRVARSGLYGESHGRADRPGETWRVYQGRKCAVRPHRRFACALRLPDHPAGAVSSPMRAKTIGVIGGLGPAATLDFFDKILR